jgi:hypothetical protein
MHRWVSSVADLDPGLGTFLTPGSGIRDGRKSASGSGIRDEQPGSYFLELKNHFFAFFGVKIHKFFDEDPGSGMEKVRIRDPGWKKVGSRIRDKHPGSATLWVSLLTTVVGPMRIRIQIRIHTQGFYDQKCTSSIL